MSEGPQEPSLLVKLRNMWEFACLMQYIYIFGKAVKIEEDFDIEVHHLQPHLPFLNLPSDVQYVLSMLLANPASNQGPRD